MAARRGFTLIEILFAAALTGVVMAGVMGGFLGMRKGQGATVSQNILKAAGQKAMQGLYMELGGCRKLLASSKLDPPTNDLGRDYFSRLAGIASPVPLGNMRFPRVNPQGGFGLPGAGEGQLDGTLIGNTLVFAASEGRLEVSVPSVTYTYGTSPSVTKQLSNQPYYLNPLHFSAYYLKEVNLPDGVAPIRLSATQTRSSVMQLVRWESGRYLDKGEFADFAAKINGGGANVKVVWDALVADHRVVGLWDGDAAAAASAFYTVDGAGAIVQVVNPAIAKRRELKAADTDMSGYAIGMVAFNSTPDYRFNHFNVPDFAPTDAAHANFPYGFEVGIVGPTGARSVLVRLALASRVNSGQHLYGLAQQEVIKVVDM